MSLFHRILRRLAGLAAALLVAGAGIGAAWAEPSLHEVYQAAQAGRIEQAQQMMDEVLRAHPDSGRAHYVRAELNARQGRLDAARSELARAESLAPGLPFAKAEAVTALRGQLQGRAAATPLRAGAAAPVDRGVAGNGIAWMPWIVGGLLVVGVVAFLRTRNRAERAMVPGVGGVPAYGGVQPPQPGYGYAPQGGVAPMGGVPSQGPGMGSGILGGLATGAAVGAGMVAGQALMHRMFDGNSSSNGSNHLSSSDGGLGGGAGQGGLYDDIGDPRRIGGGDVNADMGGNDFGIADAGSWDDGGAGGGGSDDWS